MKDETQKGIVVAFGELFLKSKSVQRLFRRKLAQNIQFFFKKEGVQFRFYEFHDRIFLEVSQIEKAKEVIQRIFGIAWYSECTFFKRAALKDISKFLERNYRTLILEKETFALHLNKRQGVWKEDTQEIIDTLARPIQRKVDLSHPRKDIFVEVRKTGCFVYIGKTQGLGGLPGGSVGKVVSLISGGIDSPVASWLIAKRGAESIWLHFHSFPLVSDASIQKVRELAQIFLHSQQKLRIYLVPFQQIQKEIKITVEPRYRVLLYRRFMVRMAQAIAQKEKSYALVTGESLGQVSSQTLVNLRIIEEATLLPILRPVIALNKEEIIRLAEKIGTFNISIKPQEDCCTLFVPKHVTANGNLEIVRALENKLAVKKLIREAFKETKIEQY